MPAVSAALAPVGAPAVPSLTTTDIASIVACGGACGLVIAAPFETIQPVLTLPGQAVTSVEAALLIVFGAWAMAIGVSRARLTWRTPLTAPWAAWIAAAFVAAFLAPAARANAVHMAGRLTLAFGVFVVTVNGTASSARIRALLAATALAGAVGGVLVLLDFWSFHPALVLLRSFRSAIAVVGAQARASGPFQYPTIASMYLEIVFALTLGLLIYVLDRRRWAAALFGIAVIAIVAEAITLTFTRAGLITMMTSLLVIGTLRVRRRGFDRGAAALAAIAVLVAAELVGSRSIDAVRLRLTTEGQDDWYRAEIKAPAAVSLPTGGTIVVPIALTNTGRVAWEPDSVPPFRFAYHWLLGDQVVAWEGTRTELPGTVEPGQSVSLQARVDALRRPGSYRIVWDIEQADQLWFSTEPDAEIPASRAVVSGPLVGPAAPFKLRPYPARAVRPRRLQLWRAAARMFAAHPLLGMGPDNFRLTYGPYAGIANADRRIHSNDMYVEVLAGMGLVGGLAFAWLCLGAYRMFVRAADRPERDDLADLAAGVTAAGVAIALHGLVDSFISFTPTYIAIAVVLGLGASLANETTRITALPPTHARSV
jgi:hypothetical protein